VGAHGSVDEEGHGMWRERITDFARGLVHPAWGLSHCERTYRMTMRLAEDAGESVREPVVFAVAYLHDAGAFAEWCREGEPQYECSARAAELVMAETGFPAELRAAVVDVIRAHDFVRPPLPTPESRFFHDADMLDFMGAVGITRLLSIVGLEDWIPDVRAAVDQIRGFAETLPDKLVTDAAKRVAEGRRREMRTYLASLDAETARLAEV
jgi:uncharacterized protein